jgi:hypothetical protein
MQGALVKWMSMGLVALVSGLCAAAAFGGRQGADDTSNTEAARFAARTMRLLAENRYSVAWRSLHPEHQQVATRAEYVACERTSLVPGHVTSLRVGRVTDERIAVAGMRRETASKAVAVRIVIADGLVPEGVIVEDVVHVIAVDGGWAWILPLARYEAYRTGACVR